MRADNLRLWLWRKTTWEGSLNPTITWSICEGTVNSIGVTLASGSFLSKSLNADTSTVLDIPLTINSGGDGGNHVVILSPSEGVGGWISRPIVVLGRLGFQAFIEDYGDSNPYDVFTQHDQYGYLAISIMYEGGAIAGCQPTEGPTENFYSFFTEIARSTVLTNFYESEYGSRRIAGEFYIEPDGPKAINPAPTDTEQSVDTTYPFVLSWEPGDSENPPDSYKVYAGGGLSLDLQGEVTEPQYTYTGRIFGPSTTWRVDSIYGAETVTGDEWTFFPTQSIFTGYDVPSNPSPLTNGTVAKFSGTTKCRWDGDSRSTDFRLFRSINGGAFEEV